MASTTNVGDTNPPDRGRGRGGGRRGGRAGRTSGTSQTSRPQVVKIGPTKAPEGLTWASEALLRESFVIVMMTAHGGHHQVTIHRPVGETPLAATDWVATPSREVDYLLARRKSEALSRWEREKEQAKRLAVLTARTGRKQTDTAPPIEVWVFDGAPPIGVTINAAMAAAKAAGRPESEWLDHTGNDAVRASELAFKQALRTTAVPADWEAAHPRPNHVTMGGPLGDRPQVAVGYLAGTTLPAAMDLVQRRVYGV